jgi:formylglycine-generating enzyme
MKRLFAVTAVVALLVLGIAAQAAITIETIAVGNAGNAADSTGYGSVGYNYRIGTYEVTAGQYTAFLSAVVATDSHQLYIEAMSSEWGCGITRSGASGSYTYCVASDSVNRPVNFVSFWSACRFANWLNNGQPTGPQNATTTERGVYTLDGYDGTDGRTIQRNANWKWAVTSEDEWYKAAYYKGGGTNAGYWDYPTSSDTAPGRDMADPTGNNANYNDFSGAYPIESGHYTTVAGEFQNSPSPYGTFDQGGNLCEWNETIVLEGATYARRGMRGGAFYGGVGALQASDRGFGTPGEVWSNAYGFRVSYVPEPSSIIVLIGGLVGLLGMRRRRA